MCLVHGIITKPRMPPAMESYRTTVHGALRVLCRCSLLLSLLATHTLVFPSPPVGGAALQTWSLKNHRTGKKAHTRTRTHRKRQSVGVLCFSDQCRRGPSVSTRPESPCLQPRPPRWWRPRAWRAGGRRGPLPASCRGVAGAHGAHGAAAPAASLAPRRASAASPAAPAGPHSRSPRAAAGG